MGAKDTKGKPLLSLLPFVALEKAVKVREFGISKYGDDSCWMKGSKQDFVEAAMRHLHKHSDALRYGLGSPLDDESGLPHTWHALCSLILAESLEDDSNNSST